MISEMASTRESGQKSGKVALIAVHGVGDPASGDTARALVSLLQRSTGGPATADYLPFAETTVEMPVATAWPTSATANTSTDVKFSIRALEGLEATDELCRYRTVRLEGCRKDRATGQHTRIDVFEMHWADFSRPPTRALRFLGELYQVFFHLASLGRKTVKAAHQQAGEGRSKAFLYALTLVHQAIEVLLPTAIPVANLFLLVPLFALAVLFVPAAAHSVLLTLLVVLIAFVAATAAAYPTRWRLGGPAAVAIAAVAGLLILPTDQPGVLLGVAALVPGFAFAWKSTRALLNRYRPAVIQWVPKLAGAVVIVFFGIALARQGRKDPFETLLLTATDVAGGIFLLLQGMWLALAFVLALACLLPFAAPLFDLTPQQRAAARTGRIGALISATLFFVATTLLWAWLLGLFQERLLAHATASFAPTSPLLHQAQFPQCCNGSGSDTTLPAFANCLFALTTGHNANFFLALLGCALLLAMVGVLPSAWYEKNPPLAADAQPPAGKAKTLWEWLNSAAVALWIAELVLIGAWVVLAWGYLRSPTGSSGDTDWIKQLGVMLAAALPLLVLFRKQFPTAATALLDIALDVSNWLRERPFATNPRGRILCRYLSLLRSIFADRYDRVVIVSHSQGTVITADLLRMLRAGAVSLSQPHPEICLLTAGSPLRQLYMARFPDLYGWIDKISATDLGVRMWVNAYRCGDYVGRNLWDGGPASNPPLNCNSPQIDISLGLGAHTHYFDRTAPSVATIVDWLVDGVHHPSQGGTTPCQSAADEVGRAG